jgi:hypothetical protein
MAEVGGFWNTFYFRRVRFAVAEFCMRAVV